MGDSFVIRGRRAGGGRSAFEGRRTKGGGNREPRQDGTWAENDYGGAIVDNFLRGLAVGVEADFLLMPPEGGDEPLRKQGILM
jgi:hypothetical protein